MERITKSSSAKLIEALNMIIEDNIEDYYDGGNENIKKYIDGLSKDEYEMLVHNLTDEIFNSDVIWNEFCIIVEDAFRRNGITPYI